MNKKIIIFMGLFFVLLLIFVFFQNTGMIKESEDFYKKQTEAAKEGAIKIAACPTFHYLKNDLERRGVEFIATESTAESIVLLSGYRVDMILAGRTLKPNEPDFDFTILKDGCCSFVSRAKARGEEEDLSSSPGQTEQILLEEDFDNFVFYTNLDPVEIKEFFPNIKTIEKVENVYEFLDNRSVGITLWENMDYSLASMVHILNPDGTRNVKSRPPIAYYRDNSALDYIDTIRELIFN